MPALIVLGDRTDHGGEVIEASGVTDTYGKHIARIGDKVHCPKKGHGTTTIIEGDRTFVIDGQGAAYHGCKTSCGAILISSQAVTTVELGSGSTAAGSAVSASAGAARTAAFGEADAVNSSPSSSEVYDDQFELRDEAGVLLAGMPYTLQLPTGELVYGTTDAQGQTARVPTDDAQTIAIFLGHI